MARAKGAYTIDEQSGVAKSICPHPEYYSNQLYIYIRSGQFPSSHAGYRTPLGLKAHHPSNRSPLIETHRLTTIYTRYNTSAVLVDRTDGVL